MKRGALPFPVLLTMWAFLFFFSAPLTIAFRSCSTDLCDSIFHTANRMHLTLKFMTLHAPLLWETSLILSRSSWTPLSESGECAYQEANDSA